MAEWSTIPAMRIGGRGNRCAKGLDWITGACEMAHRLRRNWGSGSKGKGEINTPTLTNGRSGWGTLRCVYSANVSRATRHCRGHRAFQGGTASADAARRWADSRTSAVAGDRRRRAISSRREPCQLCRPGAPRVLQRRAHRSRPHQPLRQSLSAMGIRRSRHLCDPPSRLP